MIALDLARLARAVHLNVERIDASRWAVRGGAGEHVVDVSREACDCTDFRVRGGPCKHVWAVRLRRGDQEAIDALRALVELPRRPRKPRTHATPTGA